MFAKGGERKGFVEGVGMGSETRLFKVWGKGRMGREERGKK